MFITDVEKLQNPEQTDAAETQKQAFLYQKLTQIEPKTHAQVRNGVYKI